MLKIYLGPMYSGKTTELIRNYNRFKKYNQIIVDYDTSNIKDSNIDKSTLELEGNFKYYLDTLCNHNGQAISCFKIKNINILEEFFRQNHDIIKNVKYIHINEAQFFLDLKLVVINLIERYKINVYLYGLDGDFKRQKFGEILDLIPFCDTLVKLNGICNNCDNKALFSHRICGGKEQTLFNDSKEDKYIPLCRTCFLNFNSNLN